MDPTAINRSAGRFPDGADSDSNCTDFVIQPVTTLAAASAAGATNIKVANVSEFAPGQTVRIGSGADVQNAVIATVGTAGATTTNASTSAGATVLPVASAFGFSTGQSITIDDGANSETATVASTNNRGGGSITLSAPLTRAHASGAQVSGSGITLNDPLTMAHTTGTPVGTDLPTPGAPNKYEKKAR